MCQGRACWDTSRWHDHRNVSRYHTKLYASLQRVQSTQGKCRKDHRYFHANQDLLCPVLPRLRVYRCQLGRVQARPSTFIQPYAISTSSRRFLLRRTPVLPIGNCVIHVLYYHEATKAAKANSYRRDPRCLHHVTSSNRFANGRRGRSYRWYCQYKECRTHGTTCWWGYRVLILCCTKTNDDRDAVPTAAIIHLCR